MRLKNLISLLLVGLGTIPLLAIILVGIPQGLAKLELAAQQESIINLEEKNLVLQVRFAQLKEQVMAISRLPGVNELVAGNTGIAVDMDTIRRRFVYLMQQWFHDRLAVIDLQLINKQGGEVIRLHRNLDNALLPLHEGLRPDLSSAYFFTEGMSLARDSIFVGDFQIEHERGSLDKPHPATFV